MPDDVETFDRFSPGLFLATAKLFGLAMRPDVDGFFVLLNDVQHASVLLPRLVCTMTTGTAR